MKILALSSDDIQVSGSNLEPRVFAALEQLQCNGGAAPPWLTPSSIASLASKHWLVAFKCSHTQPATTPVHRPT